MSQHSNPIQEAVVLDHLRSIGPITPLEALNLYGVFRLAARIYRLRGDGHDIITHTVHDPVNDKRYASYVLLKQAQKVP